MMDVIEWSKKTKRVATKILLIRNDLRAENVGKSLKVYLCGKKRIRIIFDAFFFEVVASAENSASA